MPLKRLSFCRSVLITFVVAAVALLLVAGRIAVGASATADLVSTAVAPPSEFRPSPESSGTFFLADNCDRNRVVAFREELAGVGARPLIAFPSAGALTAQGETSLLARTAREFGFHEIDDHLAASKTTGACARAQSRALAAWRLSRVAAEETVERAIAEAALVDPLVGDALTPPVTSRSQTGPMKGDIGIALILPESTGAIDANLENWTQDDYDKVYGEVLAGLNWWTGYAASYGVSLNFTLIDFDFGSPFSETGYEPITHGVSETCPWVTEVMDNFGYGDPNCFNAVTDFNNAKELDFGVDHVVTAFVVNSKNDADGKMPDGYSAYSYFGGPFLMMTWDNGGWGIDLMDSVLSHEITHSFWACDEYAQPGYFVCGCSCPDSPFSNDNSNCENGCGESVDCLMKNNSPTTCVHTREQIGWGAVTTVTTTTTTEPTTSTTPSTTTTTVPGGDDDAGEPNPPDLDDDEDDADNGSGLRSADSESGSCGC